MIWKAHASENLQMHITLHYSIYWQHLAAIPKVHGANVHKGRQFTGLTQQQQNVCLGVLLISF
jgi:hypothetical protein